jgi:hypothetical protein
MTFNSLTWAGAEAEHGAHLLLITFREVPKTIPLSRYPQRLNLFWEISEPHENGLPTEDEFNRIGL